MAWINFVFRHRAHIGNKYSGAIHIIRKTKKGLYLVKDIDDNEFVCAKRDIALNSCSCPCHDKDRHILHAFPCCAACYMKKEDVRKYIDQQVGEAPLYES